MFSRGSIYWHLRLRSHFTKSLLRNEIGRYFEAFQRFERCEGAYAWGINAGYQILILSGFPYHFFFPFYSSPTICTIRIHVCLLRNKIHYMSLLSGGFLKKAKSAD